MTLAELSPKQIQGLLTHAHHCKQTSLPWLRPHSAAIGAVQRNRLRLPSQSLFNKTVALMFSKRSTRTRLAAETSISLLGGRALFLGAQDIQLGVNETPRDTARVVSGMCQGIFARVGEHSEIEVCHDVYPRSFLTLLNRSLQNTLKFPSSTLFLPSGTQRKSLQTF
jgi:ornithine carbamoyltransferase